jgi:hypothetical protein
MHRKEDLRVQFRGDQFDRAWRIAFWVILILAAAASGAHALIA